MQVVGRSQPRQAVFVSGEDVEQTAVQVSPPCTLYTVQCTLYTEQCPGDPTLCVHPLLRLWSDHRQTFWSPSGQVAANTSTFTCTQYVVFAQWVLSCPLHRSWLDVYIACTCTSSSYKPCNAFDHHIAPCPPSPGWSTPPAPLVSSTPTTATRQSQWERMAWCDTGRPGGNKVTNQFNIWQNKYLFA